MVLGGKVLVVDVDLSVDKTNVLQPNIKVSNVKTSYAMSNAVSGSASNSGNSTSLDALLYGTIEKFYTEVQKPECVRDSEEAARSGATILEQLRYLVMLDKLAARQEDGGLRWFADVDQLCPVLENFAKSEGEAIALYVLSFDYFSLILKTTQIAVRHACTTGHLSPSLSCTTSSLLDFTFYIFLNLRVTACLSVTHETESRISPIPGEPKLTSIGYFLVCSSFMARSPPERCHHCNPLLSPNDRYPTFPCFRVHAHFYSTPHVFTCTTRLRV